GSTKRGRAFGKSSNDRFPSRSDLGGVGRLLRLPLLAFGKRRACPTTLLSLSSFFLSDAFLATFAIRALNEPFSSTRWDCHSASRATAICFIVRPVLTD